MGKRKKQSAKSEQLPSKDLVEATDLNDEQEQPTDPHTEQLISKQTASALLTLLFYSILMFTLPFGAFFSTRHFLREYTEYSQFAVTSLSVVASVITVYIVIGLYAYQAYHEKDYDTKTNKKPARKSDKVKQNKKK